jgi:hypothetical protein
VSVGDRADSSGRVGHSDLRNLVLVVFVSIVLLSMSVVVFAGLVILSRFIVGTFILVSSSSDVLSQDRGGQDQKGSAELHDEGGKRGFVISTEDVMNECKL